MSDVAKKAGVSITTVSHVLNETRPVADRTRARVLRAIDELDYYKNTSARLLVRGQSETLGLIISDIENPFFPELIKSFEQACAAERRDMLLCATSYEPRQTETAVRRMIENRVQGVAVMTSQFGAPYQAQLVAHDIPLVLLGSTSARQNRSHIAIDYSKGITEAVLHLKAAGHRAIALATGPQDQVSAVDHKNAVLEALREAKLNPHVILEGDHRPESGARTAQQLLQMKRRPTAIMCGNDRMAIGAIGAAAELGFAVPGDVSIVGSDDVWMARYCYPALTTVRLPRDVLGQMAFDVLRKMIATKKRNGGRHVLSTSLVVRRSTGAVNASKALPDQKSMTRVHA